MGSSIETEILKLKDSFQQAFRNKPDQSFVSSLRTAGHTVQIQTVGRNLTECITRALRPSFSPPDRITKPELTIELWSPGETGISPPAIRKPRTEVRIWPTGIGTLMISADGRFVGSEAHNELFWLDRQSKCLTGFCASEAEQSKFFKGRPLFFPLSVWHRDRGVQIIHAALVGRSGWGILLPGQSGSGKTTTAIACALAGLDFLGDDHVGITEKEEGHWLGIGLFASALLEPTQRSRFAKLRHAGIRGRPPPPDKELVFVEKVNPGVFQRQINIKAIALPRISNTEHSSLSPTGKMEAYHSLCMGSMTSVIPRPAHDDLEAFSRLVEDIPVYRFNLGKDLEHIPRAMHMFFDELASS